MTENLEELRDKDRVILKHVSEGKDDTHKITQVTTLEAHEVRYSLKKLEELGLVELKKPEGMVERVVNGQKRVFKAPLKAGVTDIGEGFSNEDSDELGEYESLSHDELVIRVHNLENQVQNLEDSFDVFRQQIQRNLK